MAYQEQLQFVRSLLSGMQIHSHVVESPENGISHEIDCGLRAMIYNTGAYEKLLKNPMNQARDNTIYRFYDEYFCHYIFMKLPDADSYFYIGPYLLVPVKEQAILSRLSAFSLEPEVLRQILRYYAALPLIEDESLLLNIAGTLGRTLWGSPDRYETEYVDYEIPDGAAPIDVVPAPAGLETSPFTLEMLEQNYACEKVLMEAVSQGKLHKVSAPAASLPNHGLEHRLSDSLRSWKNDLIILKTLLRKAAEYGGVHPLHIDRMSSRYAVRIEDIRSIESSLRLQEEMIREYCLLVKKHSLKKYSGLIGKAITLVQYDLQADLSLKSIAAQLGVSAPHLSAQFKKECGQTLTEYVNQKRIERAMSLLLTTDRLIQDIAYECGFSDANYFIRTFKKRIGMTPQAFRDRRN